MKNCPSCEINNILDSLLRKNISASYIERILRLPVNTIFKWKNGEDVEVGIIILRILKDFPWILDVANKNFNKQYVTLKIVEAAAEILKENINA